MAEPATKTANKTAKPSPRNGNVLPLGAHAANTGGRKGRSGRRPEAFTRLLARLRESPELAKSLTAAISDPNCRAFPSALKILTEYDTQRPAQKQEIVGPLVVTVRFAREGRRVTAS